MRSLMKKVESPVVRGWPKAPVIREAKYRARKSEEYAQGSGI